MINNIVLEARMVDRPELVRFSDGSSQLQFRVAHEQDLHTSFFQVELHGKLNHLLTMKARLHLAKTVSISGLLWQDRWTNKRGKKNQAVKIHAENIVVNSFIDTHKEMVHD